MSVVKMLILRWMCDKIKKNKIKNENICYQVKIVFRENKLKKNSLQWFSYIECISKNALIKMMNNNDITQVNG